MKTKTYAANGFVQRDIGNAKITNAFMTFMCAMAGPIVMICQMKMKACAGIGHVMMVIGNVVMTNVSALILCVMDTKTVRTDQMRSSAITRPTCAPEENGSVLKQTSAFQNILSVMGISTAMMIQMKNMYSVKAGPVPRSGSNVMMENNASVHIKFVMAALLNTVKINQISCTVSTGHVQVTE